MLNKHFPEISLEEGQLIRMEDNLKNKDKTVSSATDQIRQGRKPNNDTISITLFIFAVPILIIKSQLIDLFVDA